MKLPFLPYKLRVRPFRKYLREYGWTAKEIRQAAESDNEFLLRDLTYSEAGELFDAGWDAACKAIARAKTKTKTKT